MSIFCLSDCLFLSNPWPNLMNLSGGLKSRGLNMG